MGTELVVQGLGILLPIQGIWVRPLSWEYPTCHRATKPIHHDEDSVQSKINNFFFKKGKLKVLWRFFQLLAEAVEINKL